MASPQYCYHCLLLCSLSWSRMPFKKWIGIVRIGRRIIERLMCIMWGVGSGRKWSGRILGLGVCSGCFRISPFPVMRWLSRRRWRISAMSRPKVWMVRRISKPRKGLLTTWNSSTCLMIKSDSSTNNRSKSTTHNPNNNSTVFQETSSTADKQSQSALITWFYEAASSKTLIKLSAYVFTQAAIPR